jgi:hypothetical protein
MGTAKYFQSVLLKISWDEKGKSLNMVPMTVSEDEIKVKWRRGFHQLLTQKSDAGSGIND